jgi:hypothetical protein
LLAIFGFSPLAPALFADDSSNLPACCRRLGVHHCTQLPGGVSFKGVCSQYSHFPATLAQPEGAKTALCMATQALRADSTARLCAAEQGLALYRVSFNRSRHKRGPPALSV